MQIFTRSKNWGYLVFWIIFAGVFFMPQFQFELDPNDPNDIHLGIFGVILVWLSGYCLCRMVNLLQGFHRTSRIIDQNVPEKVTALLASAITLTVGALLTPWDAIWNWQMSEPQTENVFAMLASFFAHLFGPFLIAPAIALIALLVGFIAYSIVERSRQPRLRSYHF